MSTVYLFVTSFPLVLKWKKSSPQGNCSFVYERLLLRGSTGLWPYILVSFIDEIPDCRDRQILHSNSKSTGCQ